MPTRPPKPCAFPGCRELVNARFCTAHQVADRRAVEANRASAAERGYDSRWRKARAGYLAHNPLCVTCLAAGRPTAATVVDHITPHRGDKALFWNSANWQALCKPCHDTKTAREDGRWAPRPSR